MRLSSYEQVCAKYPDANRKRDRDLIKSLKRKILGKFNYG